MMVWHRGKRPSRSRPALTHRFSPHLRCAEAAAAGAATVMAAPAPAHFAPVRFLQWPPGGIGGFGSEGGIGGLGDGGGVGAGESGIGGGLWVLTDILTGGLDRLATLSRHGRDGQSIAFERKTGTTAAPAPTGMVTAPRPGESIPGLGHRPACILLKSVTGIHFPADRCPGSSPVPAVPAGPCGSVSPATSRFPTCGRE